MVIQATFDVKIMNTKAEHELTVGRYRNCHSCYVIYWSIWVLSPTMSMDGFGSSTLICVNLTPLVLNSITLQFLLQKLFLVLFALVFFQLNISF